MRFPLPACFRSLICIRSEERLVVSHVRARRVSDGRLVAKICFGLELVLTLNSETPANGSQEWTTMAITTCTHHLGRVHWHSSHLEIKPEPVLCCRFAGKHSAPNLSCFIEDFKAHLQWNPACSSSVCFARKHPLFGVFNSTYTEVCRGVPFLGCATLIFGASLGFQGLSYMPFNCHSLPCFWSADHRIRPRWPVIANCQVKIEDGGVCCSARKTIAPLPLLLQVHCLWLPVHCGSLL